LSPLPFRVKVRCWMTDVTPIVPHYHGNVSKASQGAPDFLVLSHSRPVAKILTKRYNVPDNYWFRAHGSSSSPYQG